MKSKSEKKEILDDMIDFVNDLSDGSKYYIEYSSATGCYVLLDSSDLSLQLALGDYSASYNFIRGMIFAC